MLIYSAAKNIETKNTVLIIFSLIFYGWGEPSFIVILLFMSYFDWYISSFIEKYRKVKLGKILLIVALGVNIGSLMFFKYGTFFATNLHSLLGIPDIVPQIFLPIGISFYTFQLISYLVDVYRGEVEAQPLYRRLLLYVSLFHQCIAGPIVRYKDISEQIVSRRVTSEAFRVGINRFTSGLAKKVILANVCGNLADEILLGGAVDATGEAYITLAQTTSLSLWIGCFAYALQIYLDFSAYSDMAIGMGAMVGFKYRENFNYPYIADSITDFWRRWHMSLSSFFRDYVYIPLGGNRRGNQVFNLLVVWLLTGMWHGAGWNFILWGLYYFVFLILEKFVLRKYMENLPKIVSHMYTLGVVFFSWILFYFSDMTQIGIVLKGMLCLNGNAFTTYESTTTLTQYLFFFIAAIIACTPYPRALYHKICNSRRPACLAVGGVMEVVFPALAIFISICFLVSNSYNPLLYLQF